MTSQLAMIEETIVGLKRVLARERLDQEAYDDPITQPTNRGNKTRLNSKYVHKGSLGIMNGEEFYRKKVDHAGYTRHILQYNPPRYDSEGDELDEDDSDPTADANAAEENPYSGITLETLLAPLKHPSELPDHPSMAEPYKSKAIVHMVNLIDKRLRQERYALWQAKKVHRQLLGDAPWMPCGAVENPQDRAVFEPAFLLPKALQPLTSNTSEHITSSTCCSSVARPTGLERDLQRFVDTDTRREPFQNGLITGDSRLGVDTEMADTSDEKNKAEDVQMEDLNLLEKDKACTDKVEQQDVPSRLETEQGKHRGESIPKTEKHNEPEDKETHKPPEANEEGKSEAASQPVSKDEMEIDDKPGDEAILDQQSPEPPRRMTTRAQANQVTQSQDASLVASPTSSDIATNATEMENDDAVPHPLYQFPSIKIDRNCGLLPFEAEEARHLLWAYIQKQGETVRLFADILEMLRKAYRMKEEVFEWCKAEGHIGEMSDGEDWYDRDKWGLREGEDLKKGADEEELEVDEGRASGKRGRRRA
ncbi:hypothetical protein PRK78_001095 [Emydomyces testavorans]|uniref:Transcriptional regulatory protein RXT2 N-terminal domain-containing protein n=1 Tax=Emydomyces testavorans TaxID=2070801 RepID=A0AAF0IGC3_9EURO|nr:hypothetical protein PRK78_001095 [Emydomyces testavorans]